MIDQTTIKLVLEAALDASAEIMRIYQNPFHTDYKNDGSPVTAADLASSEIIRKKLSETNIPITGEELIKLPYEVRKNWTLSWCVDPLDGTKEFIKRNGEFSINIALIDNNKAVFGMLASPVNEEIIYGGAESSVFYASYKNALNFSEHQQLSPNEIVNDPPVLCTSRAPHTIGHLRIIEMIKEKFGDIAFIKKGSALKFIDLALNRGDVYTRFAPTMEWDIAAGQAILEGLGGTVYSAATGLPLYYNKEDLYNPHFIAKTRAMAAFNLDF